MKVTRFLKTARRRVFYCLLSAVCCLLPLLASGCGTTRSTDTVRTATEQLLISNAVDQVVSQIDFRPLAGKCVFFDAQYLEGTVDKGYVVSSLRQQLLAAGCILQEDRAKATYVVEARAGGIGTDRHSLLVGIPAMTIPTFVPGQPSQIPEIPAAKKTDEQGLAKIAVFAYNRQTGRRVWQSGTLESSSDARDLWVLGMGPFRNGTILRRTEFAGEELPLPLSGHDSNEHSMLPVVPPVQAMTWKEPPPPATGFASLVNMLGKLGSRDSVKASGERKPREALATEDGASEQERLLSGSAKALHDPADPADKHHPPSHAPFAANTSGQAAGQ
jgi:hypothetical protein